MCIRDRVPTIQAFHSVVPASIFTFYDSIGFDRGVGSRPDIKYRGVRALTSVKYLLTYAGEKDADTEGFTYLTTENEFDIYTNDNYIPCLLYTSFVQKQNVAIGAKQLGETEFHPFPAA